MRTTIPLLAAVSALALAASRGLPAAPPPQEEPPSAERGSLLERGRYLAHHVALCVECHTPRDANGELVRSKLFSGAPIPVERPPYRRLEWAFASAHIAGLPGYTDEEAVRLLVRGITARGDTPRPPMPPFRMEEEDARAVVAYLRSLQ